MSSGPPNPLGSKPAAPPDGWRELAQLGRPFQLRGALKARPTGPAAARALQDLASRGAEVWLSEVGAIRLREARSTGPGLILAFQGVYSPERARPLVNNSLWADPAGLPSGSSEDEEDGVDIDLLQGAPVRVDGAEYGRVIRVMTGAQDLLLVEGPSGERWLPWAAPYLDWDGEAVVLTDPPAGLLDDG